MKISGTIMLAAAMLSYPICFLNPAHGVRAHEVHPATAPHTDGTVRKELFRQECANVAMSS
jgi:hypothetical protein